MTPLQSFLSFALIEVLLIALTVLSIMEDRRRDKATYRPHYNEPRWE